MKYRGIAGVALGQPRDTVVMVGEDGSTFNVKLKGRQLYVKKCLRPEEMGGIILCDKSRGDTVYSLILAISDDCGKWHKLNKVQKARGEVAGVSMDGVEPHMKCITPDKHDWGIRRSPYAQDEYFIREDIIKWVE